MPTKAQLQKRVQELEEENDQLQDQLDQIYDIVAPPEGQSERSKDGLTARGKTGQAPRLSGSSPCAHECATVN